VSPLCPSGELTARWRGLSGGYPGGVGQVNRSACVCVRLCAFACVWGAVDVVCLPVVPVPAVVPVCAVDEAGVRRVGVGGRRRRRRQWRRR
jgi:hypothetical protein